MLLNKKGQQKIGKSCPDQEMIEIVSDFLKNQGVEKFIFLYTEDKKLQFKDVFFYQ
jgi:hypothetical protein